MRHHAIPTSFAALILSAGLLAPALAQGAATVTINGSPVMLVPPPIERAGRIFVPLRGVFEHLGATVVYDSGQINATAGRHTVSLHIGSTQATIDSQPSQLDVAPFIVGASTYIPLRFVAQALGDTVNWDNTNRVVAISSRNGGGPPVAVTPQGQAPPPGPPQRSPLRLGTVRPERDATVATNRPTIEASFVNGTAEPNSIRVEFDGLDITQNSTRTPQGIVYSPPSDLMAAQHTVRVRGRDANGLPFNLTWSFTTGTSAVRNFVSLLNPPDGALVQPSFLVRGRTAPGATVIVQAAGQTSVGNFIAIGRSSFRAETTAGSDGFFSQPVQLNVTPGATIDIVVTSTDPHSRATAQARRSVHT